MNSRKLMKVMTMTSDQAYERYLFLAEIQQDLRRVAEHGLANLVNDRMCAINNMMTAECRKAAAMTIAGWRDQANKEY